MNHHHTPYLCLAPVHTLHTSGAGNAVQCHGKMRLVDAVIDELPIDRTTLTMKLLVCDRCGRSALPEDDAAE